MQHLAEVLNRCRFLSDFNSLPQRIIFMYREYALLYNIYILITSERIGFAGAVHGDIHTFRANAAVFYHKISQSINIDLGAEVDALHGNRMPRLPDNTAGGQAV